MATSQIVKTNVSGQIKLIDGTAVTPVELVLAFDRGDFNVSGIQQTLNEYVRIERRGKRVNTAYGNRVYPTFSFSSWVTQLVGDGSAPGTLGEFLLQQGAYSTNESVGGTGSPYALDIEWTQEGTDFGDSADTVLTLAGCEFVIDTLQEAAEGTSVSISGTVTGPVGGDWVAAELA